MHFLCCPHQRRCYASAEFVYHQFRDFNCVSWYSHSIYEDPLTAVGHLSLHLDDSIAYSNGSLGTYFQSAPVPVHSWCNGVSLATSRQEPSYLIDTPSTWQVTPSRSKLSNYGMLPILRRWSHGFLQSVSMSAAKMSDGCGTLRYKAQQVWRHLSKLLLQDIHEKVTALVPRRLPSTVY